MKKIILSLSFLLVSLFVFGQRRQINPPQPKEVILFSTFSKSDLKRLQYNKIKNKQFPYLEIVVHKNGVSDSTIYGFSKPLIEMDKIKKGFIPVYIVKL